MDPCRESSGPHHKLNLHCCFLTLHTVQSTYFSRHIFDVSIHEVMAPSITDLLTSNSETAAEPNAMKAKPNPTSDPTIYNIHHQKFTSDGLPSSTSAWLDRARQVSQILAADAAARDIDNKSPRAEIALLKTSGLLKILGPKEIGGGGQSWATGCQVIREVAKGDGSLGMLLGYHLLWSTTANVVGTEEQKHRIQKLIIENNYFVGGGCNFNERTES